jgi:tetratricopeptide (TPR) repeat protein
MSMLPTLCLNMIVKDEAHIIKETLDSVSKYIDYYVISDTGSSDTTVDIITDYFKKKNIKGEIYHDEWINFDYNRSLALKYAYGKSEYIWVIDADDIIVGEMELTNLTKDFYYITIGKNFSYRRKNIFKNFKDYLWRYVEPRHEYPVCDKPNMEGGHIEGNYYLDSRRLGNRSNDKEKYLKDALVFEEALKQNPDNERNTFYCGRSYFDHGLFIKAIEFYEKRAKMGGYLEEVYYSLYQIGLAREHLGSEWEITEKAYLDAHIHSPHRSEPIYQIALHYRLNNNYEKAYQYAVYGQSIPYPTISLLFISSDIYKWKMLEECALSAYYSNRVIESHLSYSKLVKMVKNTELSGNVSARILSGIKFAENKINKKSCLIYFGNKMITVDNKAWVITDYLSTYYDISVFGTNIEDIPDENIIYKKSIDIDNKYDLIIIYNITPAPFSTKNVILFIDRPLLTKSFSTEPSVDLVLHNITSIRECIKSVNKIVCIDDIVKTQFIQNYGIFDKLTIENPSFIKTLDDIDCFDLSFVSKNINININNCKYKEDFMHYSNKIKQQFNDMSATNNMMNKLLKDGVRQDLILFDLATACFNNQKYKQAIKNYKKSLEYNGGNEFTTKVTKLEIAKCYFELKNYNESFKLSSSVLDGSQQVQDVRDKNIEFVKDSFTIYPEEIIKKIKETTDKSVILVMTTCKRFDLFEKTINSFLNCCIDSNLIDHWLIIDDNSSDEDKNLMKTRYPFFRFIFKNEDQKGHVKTMNILRDEIPDYEYCIHLEDDFHFIEQRKYVTDSINILKQDKNIMQVQFNKNYAEIEPINQRIYGGKQMRTIDGLPYVLHEYVTDDVLNNKLPGLHNRKWPHYSFRPSMIKTNMLQRLGKFHESNHFELDYARVYIAAGYLTAFFDTFACIHIGKKTWEKGINSYNLNNVNQFFGDTKLNIHILSCNNKQGTEQWLDFKKNNDKMLNSYTRQEINNCFTYDMSLFVNTIERPELNYLLTHRNIWSGNDNEWTFVSDDHCQFNIPMVELCGKLINESEDSTTGYKLGNRTYLISQKGKELLLNTNFTTNSLRDHLLLLTDSSELDSVVETELSDNKIELEGYEFCIGMDSFSDDKNYYPNKSINELKNICDTDSEIIAFNTLGYVKKRINKLSFLSSFNNDSHGLYIKTNEKIIKDKINKINTSILTNNNNITFTITSCKRLNKFIDTMNNLLLKCEDLHIIDRWLCIDDNSKSQDIDVMKTEYPFLEIITKNEKDKGHAKSMNQIMDLVKTDYVMHFEDDWLCKEYFKISGVFQILKLNICDQIILKQCYGVHLKIPDISIEEIYNYVYNPDNQYKPDHHIEYEKSIGMSSCKKLNNNNWWWPGFTLNPSLFNITKFKENVGIFKENIDHGQFEYDYSLRSYKENMKICFIKNQITHIGDISSYDLNGTGRFVKN